MRRWRRRHAGVGQRASGGAIKAAASLTGTVGAAHEAGGMRGVARATVAAPASSTVGSVTGPVRDAYRQGAAHGFRTGAPPSSDGDGGAGGAGSPGSGGSPPPSVGSAPGWAQSLARRQRLTQAGMVAAHTVREGDRPASGSGPELKDKS